MSAMKKSNLKVTVEEHREENNASPNGQSILQNRSPRVARFAEATTMYSPPENKKNPFQGSPIDTNKRPWPEAGHDAQFSSGYSADNAIRHTSVVMPTTPFTPVTAQTPGALRVPGTPGRFLDPRSPTFKEELALEKEEVKTEKQNAEDLKVKTRVRIAKFFLRGVNFGCSLIVLSMLSTTFVIFNATKSLPPRNNLPPWASGQQTWPQITLLVMACVSLFICVCIFWGYWKGGHRKAAKTQTYYTLYAVGFFIFSTVMWIVGAVVLHQSRQTGSSPQDMWGWSCNMNKRETLFNDTVNYALICRLQNWSLICALIEVTVEVITIAIYAITFYRFRSKRKLMKEMNTRDKARNDLYLAQLKLQSAPNTPGFPRGAKSIKSAVAPTFGAISEERDLEAAHIDESDLEYQRRYEEQFGSQVHLAAPTIAVTGATPNVDSGEFESPSTENVHEHFEIAGEQTYDAVPIPGAYAGAKPQH